MHTDPDLVLESLSCAIGLVSDGNEAMALDLLALLHLRIAQDAAVMSDVSDIIRELRQPIWVNWTGATQH